MQTIKHLFVVILISLFFSCSDEVDDMLFQKTGLVVDYAGSGNCGFVIEMDDGSSIIPISYPQEFKFAQGQRVWVEYKEMSQTIPVCDKGAASEIKSIEELNCEPYVDLYFSNYDSLARDPIFVHEAYMDGNCLHLKLSYSGGCQDHIVDLARMHPWGGTQLSTLPVFEIRHNNFGDACEAYLTKEFRFDLSALKDEGKKTFILKALLTDGQIYSKTLQIE